MTARHIAEMEKQRHMLSTCRYRRHNFNSPAFAANAGWEKHCDVSFELTAVVATDAQENLLPPSNRFPLLILDDNALADEQ